MYQQKMISLVLKGSPVIRLDYVVAQDYLEHLQRTLSDDELSVVYLLRAGVMSVTVESHNFSEDER